MIRLTLLIMFCVFLCIYAWRDWFKALCGLIVMMAVVEHPDMPKTIMGIQGLNPWNICLFVVVLAWLAQRRKEGLKWDMPRGTTFLLWTCLIIIVVNFIRLLLSLDDFYSWWELYQRELPSVASLRTIPTLLEYWRICAGLIMPWAVLS